MKTKATVLAVEDLRLVARDLEARLRRMGYRATVVSSAPAAIEALEAVRPDIVLLDIELDGSPMDGPELAQVIRQRQDVPIIFLTAHADEQTVQRAQAVGPSDYLLKPFDDVELDRAIQRALGRERV